MWSLKVQTTFPMKHRFSELFDSFIWHLLCHQTPAIDQIQEMVDLSPSPATVQNQIITGLNLKASCLKNENQISPLGY